MKSNNSSHQRDEVQVLTNDLPNVPGHKKSFRFYTVMATLCCLSILSALENTVVTTSLPSIATELHLGDSYVWVTSAFFLGATVIQPPLGQLADIFGRRWVTIGVIALFVLGSGLCGGATNAAMIIAGRAIQGMGGGGLNTLPNIIVSDLLSVRERGKYVAFFLVTYFIGLAIGPYVGGAIVQSTTWRWVFYLNLPIGGVSIVMVFLFLDVNYDKEMSLSKKLKRIDYIGNFLFTTSLVAILYALSYGGSSYSWSSWHILVPLVVGMAGIVLFMVFEASGLVKEPVCPPRLFGTCTSVAVMIITCISSGLLYWVYFFMPVYFQAVRASSPSMAGLQVLPGVVVTVPFSIVAVLLLSRFGRYKPIHLAGVCLLTLGLGLMTLLNKTSSSAEWIIFQAINAIGNGLLMNSLLPVCQAAIGEADQAAVTAVWSSIRSFGSIWGVIIPEAIFNNRFEQLAPLRKTDTKAELSFSMVMLTLAPMRKC